MNRRGNEKMTVKRISIDKDAEVLEYLKLKIDIVKQKVL
jgi:hypothetical protein